MGSVVSYARSLAWLTSTTEQFGRWALGRDLVLPNPLSSSYIGRYAVPIDEYLAAGRARPVPARPSGEQQLLDLVDEVLRAPAHSGFVIHAVFGGPETCYAGFVGGDRAVLVIDAPGQIRVAQVPPHQVATSLVAALPRIAAAPVGQFEMPARTTALVESGQVRGVPARTLAATMESADIPADIAARLLAGEAGVRAIGHIGALSYASVPARSSTKSASWTEMTDGAMICTQGRGGGLAIEPFTTDAVARALAAAITSVPR